MLERWAQWLTTRFVQFGIVKKNEVEIYNYCFEVLLGNLAYYGTITLITILTQKVAFAICYTMGFILIRHTSGGYHAQSHLRCYVLSLTVYLMALAIWCLFSWDAGVVVLSSWIVMVVLWCIGPVEHENKPLSAKEVVTYRKKSRKVSLLLALGITILCGAQQVEVAAIFMLGFLSAVLSGAAGQIVNKERERANEEIIL